MWAGYMGEPDTWPIIQESDTTAIIGGARRIFSYEVGTQVWCDRPYSAMTEFLASLERARLQSRKTRAILVIPQKRLVLARTLKNWEREGRTDEDRVFNEMVARNHFWLVDLMRSGLKDFFTGTDPANVFGHARGVLSRTINVILVLALGKRPDQTLFGQIKEVRAVSDAQGTYQSTDSISELLLTEARWCVRNETWMRARPPADKLTRGWDEFPDQLRRAITKAQAEGKVRQECTSVGGPAQSEYRGRYTTFWPLHSDDLSGGRKSESNTYASMRTGQLGRQKPDTYPIVGTGSGADSRTSLVPKQLLGSRLP